MSTYRLRLLDADSGHTLDSSDHDQPEDAGKYLAGCELGEGVGCILEGADGQEIEDGSEEAERFYQGYRDERDRALP